MFKPLFLRQQTTDTMTGFSLGLVRRSRNSSPRRDSETSIPPPPSGKVLRYFLNLPSSILDLICVYLEDEDLKNFSLTSYAILDKVELTRELAPRFRVFNLKSVNQVNLSHRISHDLVHLETTPSYPRDRPYLLPEKDHLPEYSQLTQAAYHNAFRTQRVGLPITVQAWICPHIGCTATEAFALRKQRPLSQGLPRDTTPACCPFPKCSLWARHALVETVDDTRVFELCSVIKVCRYRCQSVSQARQVLATGRNKNILNRAIHQLHIPVCSHLLLSDDAVHQPYDPADVAILDAHTASTATNTLEKLEQDLDRHSCEDCRSAGTYTTWGFIARYVSDATGSWLDVELMLCRPLYDAQAVGSPRGVHWRHHTTRFPQSLDFVDSWWKWAEVVAEDGFDWRARLPAQFLLRSQGQLADFPARPPRYDRLVKAEKLKAVKASRWRSRQILGIA